VSSFLPEVLLRLHEIDDQIPLGYICERPSLMDRWRDLPIKVFLPRHDLLRSELIEEAHRRGMQIMTWTANSARRMRQLADWGVDGLISDDPQLLFRTLGAGLKRE
jgi:glycerophosphoryl diester phosphodiesterase